MCLYGAFYFSVYFFVFLYCGGFQQCYYKYFTFPIYAPFLPMWGIRRVRKCGGGCGLRRLESLPKMPHFMPHCYPKMPHVPRPEMDLHFGSITGFA